MNAAPSRTSVAAAQAADSTRPDGTPPPAPAPDRLLNEAARVFAEKGFDAASTREICQAAGVNAAAIHYHFGDKAGLYRAVLWASIERVVSRFPRFDPHKQPRPGLQDSLRAVLQAFIDPLQKRDQDPTTEWYCRIHLREALEPSPQMEDLIASGVLPHYANLVQILAEHCQVAVPDDELHRLTFAIVAMANDYCKSEHWIRALAPGLLAGEDALEKVLESLTGYACALVHFEIQRRNAAVPPTSTPSQP